MKLLGKLEQGEIERMKEYYESRVIKRPGCWGWKGAKDENGYGRIRTEQISRHSNRNVRAHRFAYEIYVRALEEGELVLHDCDQPSCTNPKHLHAGTHQQNHREAVERGRHAKGEKAGNASITEAQAREIKRWLEAGEFCSDIAREIGCGEQVVQMIAEGRNWKHLGPIKRRRKAAAECKLRAKWKPGGYKVGPSEVTQHRS
jgi:hypothetical protein